MRGSILSLCVVSICITVSAWAEEPRLGRLSDGRAYRVDADGNQLVDYIAELELSVDALQRQVTGLEGEVASKQALVEQLRRGAAESALTEVDLYAKQEAQTDHRDEKIAAAEESIKRCQTQVEKLAGLLKESDTDRSSQLAAATEKQQAIVAELQKARAEVAERDAQITQLKASIRVASEVKPVVVAMPVEDRRASFSSARDAALSSIRGKIQTELNQLKQRIAQRDEKYKVYRGIGGQVSFTLQPLRSSRGRTIDAIRSALPEADSGRLLSELQKDAREILAIVNDDIALMERMQRLSSGGR